MREDTDYHRRLFDRGDDLQVAARRLKIRFSPSAPIHTVEHQTVQMDVQVGGRAESLNQRDRACIGCSALQASLLAQKSRRL
jgi:hypothetical protein